MRNVFSKIKWFFVMAFVATVSFVSKVLGQSVDLWYTDRGGRGQSYYGVEMPNTYLYVKEPEPSLYSTVIDTIVKCVEILLVVAIFIVGIVGFLKIRKIDDKQLKTKKIKRTIITIIVLLVIGILIGLGYRLYNKYF